MKKRLRFLYRYFTTTPRWRRWINTQNLMVLVVSAVFLFTLLPTAPLFAQDNQPSAQITATADPLMTATPTGLPPEFLTNSEQTIGITLAATVLVLIVIAGAVLFIPRRTES